MASFLLDAGADVNERDTCCDLGFTPLHHTTRSDSLHCVTLLLERGADTRKRDLGHAQSLPVEGCLLGGNMRLAHKIFS